MTASHPLANACGRLHPTSDWLVSYDVRWRRPQSAPWIGALHRGFIPWAGDPSSVTRPLDRTTRSSTLRTARSARVEAILFISDGPIPSKKIAQLASLTDFHEADQLIAWLNASYESSGSPWRIEQIAGGYRLYTLPAFHQWLAKLNTAMQSPQLTPSTLETLAIVAYRQPITRADIEQIRGVQCVDLLKQLMEDGYLRLAGEDTSLGRPFLYETTRKFLEDFGLADLEQLPFSRELRLSKSMKSVGDTGKAA